MLQSLKHDLLLVAPKICHVALPMKTQRLGYARKQLTQQKWWPVVVFVMKSRKTFSTHRNAVPLCS